METKDLQEQVHSLAHYLAQGHDWKWTGQRGAHDGKVVISVEVDAFTFWDLHAQQQQHREELRKQRAELRRVGRERALGRRGLPPGAKARRPDDWR
jgi:hypothetical protein